jgi:hypothetical protein
MSEVITEKHINKLSIEEQLKFYKKYFQYQHCQLDGCGHEIRDDWALFDDTLYCYNCYEWMIETEKENAKKEISKHQKQIDELKEKYDLL